MRTTYLNSLSVVSAILFTMVFTIVPARADVNITAAQVGETNEVIISFDATTETNLVRAFALDIRLDNEANIVAVTGLSADYYIYPGTIRIDAQGNVIDFGSPVAEYSDLPSGTLLGLDSNGITIEMASLYAPVGPDSPNAPAKSGDLLSIIVSDYTCINITPNVARIGTTGVVMEDPNQVVNVYMPSSICYEPPPDCMPSSATEYPIWVEWGKPECWCNCRHCHGDADGIKTGPFWVAIPDLIIFRSAFNKIDTVVANTPNGICADFDHIKFGPFRVSISDLNIFRQYFNKPESQVPDDCYFWCFHWPLEIP